MNRIICWFSCGAASAVATKLALSKYQDREILIARVLVAEEHEDNDRFAADCAAWFGHPITNMVREEYGGSVFRVIEKRGYISGVRGAPCTLELKKRVREEMQRPTDHHVFGYCAEEQGRWDRFLDGNNISAEAPLIDRGLEHPETLAMIQDAGIKLPVMYGLGFKHNNCIGCVKSTGAGYWNMIRDHFPIQFDRMAAVSRNLKVRMVELDDQRIYLDDLPKGRGDYLTEPEIQCGIFCEMAQKEYT